MDDMDMLKYVVWGFFAMSIIFMIYGLLVDKDIFSVFGRAFGSIGNGFGGLNLGGALGIGG
jgi:hypothetical protein